MSRLEVWSAGVALSCMMHVGIAQSVSATNTFSGVNKVIPYGDTTDFSHTRFDVTFAPAGNDIHGYQSVAPIFNSSGQVTGVWMPDVRNVDSTEVEATDPQTALLGSFVGTDPNGSWTLVLADLNAGEQGNLVKWGLDITTIPEPPAGAVMAAGLLLGLRAWRHRSVK